MKTSNHSLSQALWLFSQRYLQEYRNEFNHLPIIETDKNWPSPCEQGIHLKDYTLWQPQLINNTLNFDNVESALEITLHADVKEYFTTVYSDSLDASCIEGELSLLLPWSDVDFSRLQENIIGHVIMKGKLKQKLTIFFAVTDNDNHILSIDNEDGTIWVEKVGCEPHKKVADSMVEFLALLTPRIPPNEQQ
jgi:SecY interacting protein Syd